jgi:hypothetical protein
VDQTRSANEEEQMYSMLTQALSDDRVAQWRRDAEQLTQARKVIAANRERRSRGARNGRQPKRRSLQPAGPAAASTAAPAAAASTAASAAAASTAAAGNTAALCGSQ